MTSNARPPTRRATMALRAQERRQMAEQRTERPADAAQRLEHHLREARIAALEQGRFIVSAEIDQILRLVDARRRP